MFEVVWQLDKTDCNCFLNIEICVEESRQDPIFTIRFMSSLIKHFIQYWTLFSVGITWVDAPLLQFARVDADARVKCKVQANPAANVDWLKEASIISSGSQYVIETEGLVIKSVQKSDSGTYTCRARVPQTGELEERHIQLDVSSSNIFNRSFSGFTDNVIYVSKATCPFVHP